MSREDNLRLETPNNICWNTPTFTQAHCHGFTLFFVEVVVERNHEGVELKKLKFSSSSRVGLGRQKL